MRTVMPAFLAANLSLFAALATDDAKSDGALIQGTWRVTLFQEGCRKHPMGMKVVITKNRYTVKVKDLAAAKTYKLDPTKTPKWFDLESVKAPGGIEMGPNLGIYELEGDDLKICFGRSGKARPTSFDPSKDPAADVLLILKREKP